MNATHTAILSLLLGVPSLAGAQEDPVIRLRELPQVKTVIVDENGNSSVVANEGVAWVDGDGGHANLRYLHFPGQRRYIGVQLIALTPELRRHFGADEEAGVLVSKTLASTPAETAGIEVGDILLSADGEPLRHSGDLGRVIAGKQPEDSVEIELLRDGRRKTLAVGFEERERMLLDVTPRILRQGKAYVLKPGGAPHEIDIEKLHQLDLGELPHIELDRFGDVGATLERLDEYFESDEWQERLERLEDTDWSQVERRMKEVERRLRELEQQLDEK